MFTLFDTNWNQILQGNVFSIFRFLYHSLYEWTIVLAGVLLVYYFVTLKRRYVLQTALGIPATLLVAIFHLLCIPEELQDGLRGYLTGRPGVPLWLGIPLLLIVLAAIVLCVVNLIRRKAFSKKQVLWLTVPFWAVLVVNMVFPFLPGARSNLLIGYLQVLLALVLTLTLLDKEQFFFVRKKTLLLNGNQAETENKE